MPFIRTVPLEEATGQLKELYDRDVETQGRVSTVTEAWSLRPDVLAAWRALFRTIAAPMDRRRVELIILVAASRVKCSI